MSTVTTRTAVSERPAYDFWLLFAVLALCVLGVVMVYSSSAVFAGSRLGDGAYFLKRQAVFALLGMGVLATVMRVGHQPLHRLAYPLLGVCAVLVLLTLIPGLGARGGGAQRWLQFPGFRFQPSEFAKLALCIYLARALSEKGDRIRDFRVGVLPHLVVLGGLGGLVLLQPDFGTMVVMLVVTVVVLFMAGAGLRFVLIGAAVAAPVVVALVVSSPYRMRRIFAFLDPFADRYGAGYQVAEALMSVGSGGLFGRGLGDGRQKLGFLPAGHTDYILASVGEELGLVGMAFVLGLFALLIWRGLLAAWRASDAFGCYLAFALTTLIAVETAINSGMCLGLLPSKGLALPFLSYGGTSLLKAMTAAGILLSISGGGGGFLRPAQGATRCT